jgi:hypothetical protein
MYRNRIVLVSSVLVGFFWVFCIGQHPELLVSLTHSTDVGVNFVEQYGGFFAIPLGAMLGLMMSRAIEQSLTRD